MRTHRLVVQLDGGTETWSRAKSSGKIRHGGLQPRLSLRPLSMTFSCSTESDSLGMLSEVAGILLRRLNIVPRPIANK